MWVPQPHVCVSGYHLESFLNDRLLRHRLGRKLGQSCFAGMRMVAAKSFHEDKSVLKLVIIFYLGPNSPTALLHRYARQQGEAPQIRMRSVARHRFKVQCTVQQGSLSVFVNCPSLPDSPCYENCIPTQPCPKGTSGEGCLPDKTAVNCTETATPSGGKVTTLWIDNRDPRLLGDWICMNRGLKSSKVEVRF